jgi:hypothetical protein
VDFIDEHPNSTEVDVRFECGDFTCGTSETNVSCPMDCLNLTCAAKSYSIGFASAYLLKVFVKIIMIVNLIVNF